MKHYWYISGNYKHTGIAYLLDRWKRSGLPIESLEFTDFSTYFGAEIPINHPGVSKLKELGKDAPLLMDFKERKEFAFRASNRIPRQAF